MLKINICQLTLGADSLVDLTWEEMIALFKLGFSIFFSFFEKELENIENIFIFFHEIYVSFGEDFLKCSIGNQL